MKEVVTIQLNCTPPKCPNISDFIGDDPLYVYDKPQNIVLISIYLPLFLAALVGNILVIIVVSRYRCLRSVTNYFLVSLSVSDLLVTLLCMPMAVGQATYSLWVYGDFMCKLSNYLQGVAVSSGVFTITAMSLDRYMAIRHPMSRKIINRQRARKIIVLIWMLALAVFGPILFIRKTQGFRFAWDVDQREFLYCVESWPDNLSQRSFGIFCFVAVYAIPGCIVVVAYSLMGLRLCSRHLIPEYQLTHIPSATKGINNNGPDAIQTNSASSWQVSSAGGRLIRERRRVAKILLVLALVFAFCWLPYSVLTLILDLSSKAESDAEHEEMDEQLVSIATSLIPFSLLLGHVNSVVNPLLYCMLSKNFRRSVTDFIRHPLRAIRSRNRFKIKMTFRCGPHSVEPNSTENKPNACRPRNPHAPNLPQTQPPATNSNGSRSHEPHKVCLQEMPRTSSTNLASHLHQLHQRQSISSQLGSSGVHAVVSYSPSSSGYSSSRGSTENICCSVVHCHSSQYPYFGNSSTSNGLALSNPGGYRYSVSWCRNTIHSGYLSPPSSISFGKNPAACVNGICYATHLGSGNTHDCCICSLKKQGFISTECKHRIEVPSTIREESESYHSQVSRSVTLVKSCNAKN